MQSSLRGALAVGAAAVSAVAANGANAQSETPIPRSAPGDKGKYYLLESKKIGDVVQALHKRVGVDSTDFTRTETNCATRKMREIGTAEGSAQKIKGSSRRSGSTSCLVPARATSHSSSASGRSESTMAKLDLEKLIGKADRDLFVLGMQALHAQRVAAWNAQNAHAHLTGQTALNAVAFGLDAAAAMLRRLGAAPNAG